MTRPMPSLIFLGPDKRPMDGPEAGAVEATGKGAAAAWAQETDLISAAKSRMRTAARKKLGAFKVEPILYAGLPNSSL